MSSPSYTQQVESLIDQISKRNAFNCSLAFVSIAVKLKELYENRIVPEPGLTIKLRNQVNEKNEDLKRQLEQIADLKNLLEQNKTLFEEENRIENQIIELEQKEAKIAELKQKKKELEKAENSFKDLDKTIAGLNLQNDELIGRLTENLNGINALLDMYSTQMDKQFKQIIRIAKENLAKINTQSKELLEGIDTNNVKIGADSLDKELDSIISGYNMYAVKVNGIIKELDEIKHKYSDVKNQYQERLEKDIEIYGAIEDPKAFRRNVEEIVGGIEQAISDFEAKIKTITEERSQFSMLDIYEKQYDKINNKSL